MDPGLAEPFYFWFIALAMTGIALGFVLPRLFARRASAKSASPTAANLDVYRRQLAELDRDVAAGALGEREYRQARRDLERRLLAETGDEPPAAGRPRATPGAAIGIGIALPALAFGLYAWFGDPGALPQPSASTPPFDVAAADDAEALRAKLTAHLVRLPGDGRAWVLLARLDFEAERFPEAAAAYAKALSVSAKVARDAGVWCEYADALGMTQGGSLAGKPRELIAHALTLDAAHPKALEMAGSAALEQNDPGAAAGYWRQLLAQLPAGSQERRELAAAVARAEQLAAAGGDAAADRQ